MRYYLFGVKVGLIVSVLGVILFILFFYNQLDDNKKYNDISEFNKIEALIAQVPIKIEIADTQSTRIRGLSGFLSLDKDSGLLFVFETDDFHGIWMKEMNFSIDIIWLNADLEIIYIEKNISPETYPKTFRPNQEARYVLEVPAGFSDNNDLKIADQLKIL